MKIQLVNCVKHDVDIVDEDGRLIETIPPSGMVTRVQGSQILLGYLNGIPVHRTVFDEAIGLPPPKDGVIYIVSTMACMALQGVRDDVVSPNTGDSVYKVRKQVAGVQGYQVFGTEVRGMSKTPPAQKPRGKERVINPRRQV